MQPDDNAQGMACLALQDQVCDEAAKSRDRKGGRGGAAKSGGTGQRRDVQVSRALSRLLRHQADTAGINLDGEGFAPLDKVVSARTPFSYGFLFCRRGVVSQRSHVEKSPRAKDRDGGDSALRLTMSRKSSHGARCGR